jgi:hypothetical protein
VSCPQLLQAGLIDVNNPDQFNARQLRVDSRMMLAHIADTYHTNANRLSVIHSWFFHLSPSLSAEEAGSLNH